MTITGAFLIGAVVGVLSVAVVLALAIGVSRMLDARQARQRIKQRIEEVKRSVKTSSSFGLEVPVRPNSDKRPFLFIGPRGNA